MSDAPLASYRELQAWQKGIVLVEAIYQLSAAFPQEERFGLTSQIRKAAVSVPSNIAEGYGRLHRGDYVHHLSISNGSLKEVETQLIIAGRLGFVSRDEARLAWDLSQDVGRLLLRLIESLHE